MDANANRAGTPARQDLVLERLLPALPSVVFAAWTEPAQLARWWGPHGFTAPRCEFDPRSGGAIYIDMRGPDGTIYPMTGEVREIDPPRRLSFLSAVPGTDGRPIFEVLTTVTFEERGGQTLQTLRAHIISETPEAAPSLDGMATGWSQSLERLEAMLNG